MKVRQTVEMVRNALQLTTSELLHVVQRSALYTAKILTNMYGYHLSTPSTEWGCIECVECVHVGYPQSNVGRKREFTRVMWGG